MRPGYTVAGNKQRGGLAWFLYTLRVPALVISFLGWIMFLVGFGWWNEEVFNPGRLPETSTGRGTLAGFYFLSVASPIFFILHSIYMFTGLWIIGIVSQLMAALVMIFAGGIAYVMGAIVMFFGDIRRHQPIPRTDEENFAIVAFVGSLLIAIGLVISEALIPIVSSFHRHKVYHHDSSYSGRSGSEKLKTLMYSLPTIVVALLGWFLFLVGFGWLNNHVFQARGSLISSTDFGRWVVACYYILTSATPIHLLLSSFYMYSGHPIVGIISQFVATVVTLSAGAIVYETGVTVSVTNIHKVQLLQLLQLLQQALQQQQDSQDFNKLIGDASNAASNAANFIIVVFTGTVLLCLSMAVYHALVPVISSLIHNKPQPPSNAVKLKLQAVSVHDDCA